MISTGSNSGSIWSRRCRNWIILRAWSASAHVRQIRRVCDRVELHVPRSDDRRRDGAHELGDVGGGEMALQRFIAVPLLDEHELVSDLGVLIEAVAGTAVLLT